MKTVLITGASGGIGEGCARLFAKNGARLVLCARNREKLELLAVSLKSLYGTEIYAATVDVRKREEVFSFVESLPSSFRTIDVLVNNAGLARGLEKFPDNSVDDWEEMIDTNVKGLLYFTKAILPLVIANPAGGNIINIGSLAGVAAYPNGAVYCATKAAVKFISDGLRQDIADTPVRITNIQPGMVETNFSNVRFHGDDDRAKNTYKGITPLNADDIADLVYFAASRPPHVQICEITVTPTHQATGGVVYRKSE